MVRNIYTPQSVRAAFTYAGTRRSKVKGEYAKAVVHARVDGAEDDPSSKSGLSFMAAQGVRMDLDEIFVKEETT